MDQALSPDNAEPDVKTKPYESTEDKAWASTREAGQSMYLDYLREGYSYLEAAAALGIARSTGYRWRQDPEFLKLCIAAHAESVPKLESVAYNRAIKGSDKLMIFLLQARDPAKYNPVQKVEHSGTVDVVNTILAARKRSGTA